MERNKDARFGGKVVMIFSIFSSAKPLTEDISWEDFPLQEISGEKPRRFQGGLDFRIVKVALNAMAA
jgi:hypothetical protein